MKSRIKKLITLVACVLFISMMNIQAWAAGTVSFGSESYTRRYDNDFEIGLYIQAEEDISKYEVKLSYDADMIEFVSGGEPDGNGNITVSGTGSDKKYKVMLQFHSKLPGSTELKVEDAKLFANNGVNNTAESQIHMEPYPAAPITIQTDKACELQSLTTKPVDISGFNTEQGKYSISVGENVDKLEVNAQPIDTTATVTVSDADLKPGSNRVMINVSKDDRSMQYMVYVDKAQAAKETANTVSQTVQQTVKPSEVTAEKEEPLATIPWWKRIRKKRLAVIIAGIVLICILAVKLRKYLRHRSLVKKVKARQVLNELQSKDSNLRPNIKKATAVNSAKVRKIKPVISIQDVSMKFRMAEDESSSLKEFLIRTVKGKNNIRTFTALSHINLNIYKGEVVGIIGTNGSGKSTLLKIVSGALKPTEGKVFVNFRKVQLLTLGTGFDMELTAKENVYLNGAIIGYSKEYIDEKYDDIVKFAELEGFMDEKVKNFSSGMVSRLGFAIATMRDTPEILILDEVLSVGDMFFRKKSEKRIKEMINSGSTVLIVSHSTQVITSNCTKAVWIEKGVMKAVGDPKEVCKQYENMSK